MRQFYVYELGGGLFILKQICDPKVGWRALIKILFFNFYMLRLIFQFLIDIVNGHDTNMQF